MAEKSWIEGAVEYMALPQDLREPESITEYCKQLGVPRATFYYEMSKTEIQKRIVERAVVYAKKDLPEVLDVLGQKAKTGNTRAIELYLKYVAELAEKFTKEEKQTVEYKTVHELVINTNKELKDMGVNVDGALEGLAAENSDNTADTEAA